ncbi:MAG: haloacid dehalogenase type II [Chloroflexi bacterium]|nr:MAG: haloacid dehalogenase type II [Chloroflexota bacterium]
MSCICVFDVNETLLDLRALDTHFERAFGDASVRQAWFTQLLQTAFISTITGNYKDFGTIGAAALDMIATRRGVTISQQDRTSILQGMRQLPPHPDVRDGLERLRNAGLRLVTLTNSTEQVAQEQIKHAGLNQYFEHIFSADTVQRLKPAPEPYRMVAKRLGVDISQTRLIAAHSWDIAGALHAGCAAAFIHRTGMVLDPLFQRPDVVGADLREVADRILEKEGG